MTCGSNGAVLCGARCEGRGACCAKHACLSTTAGGKVLGVATPGQVHVVRCQLKLSRVLLLAQLPPRHYCAHGCEDGGLCLGIPCLRCMALDVLQSSRHSLLEVQ